MTERAGTTGRRASCEPVGGCEMPWLQQDVEWADEPGAQNRSDVNVSSAPDWLLLEVAGQGLDE